MHLTPGTDGSQRDAEEAIYVLLELEDPAAEAQLQPGHTVELSVSASQADDDNFACKVCFQQHQPLHDDHLVEVHTKLPSGTVTLRHYCAAVNLAALRPDSCDRCAA